MLNTQAVQDRDSFIEEHSPCVRIEGFILFHDGAVVEDNPLGRLIEPPNDDYECCQLVERYWHIVAEADEQAFTDFKNYLSGSGARKTAWASLYTDEARLNHLKVLQQTAKRSKAKYLRAKREVAESRPFHLDEREKADAESDQQRQQFLSQVSSIKL